VFLAQAVVDAAVDAVLVERLFAAVVEVIVAIDVGGSPVGGGVLISS